MLDFSNEERNALRLRRKPKTPIRVKRSTMAMGLLGSLLIAAVVLALPLLSSLPPSGPIHWHPQLRITIDGNAVTVPANIGIDPSLWRDHSLDEYSSMQDMPDGMSGMAPLHTHDTAGTIHVESRVTREYTLGEFFRIWGQTFDGQQVLGHTAVSGHRVSMTANGVEVTPSYAVALQDGMRIEIRCG